MLLNYARLYEIAEKCKHTFKKAKPFPHIVIDNFLEDREYKSIRNLYPDVYLGTPDNRPHIWKRADNPHTEGKYTTRSEQQFKIKEHNFGELRPLFLEFNSGIFIGVLQRLTGMTGLIGDPFFREAGFHAIERGGFLDSHVDFSHHEDLGLERRINFFLFFNDNWKDEWGGHLSLFNPKGEEVQKIAPIGNRCVIFEPSEVSFHGHPRPLNCPEGVFRRSIALYYYTAPTGREYKKIVFHDTQPKE